jgi:hypothetical protein
LARGARNGYYFGRRERKPEALVAALARTATVRADHRLRADEKHIRTQSAIFYKSDPKPWLLL